MIDIGANLAHDTFDHDRDAVLERARGAGVTRPTTKPRDRPGPDHWYKKPIPVIALAVVSGCILLVIRYVLKVHFDFPI